jgi:hypothetical protein
MFLGEEDMEPTQIKALELKAALDSDIEACALPSKALAELLDVAYTTLRAYVDPSVDLHIPSHRLPRLLALTPGLATVRYLANLQAAVVVALPKAGESDRCKLPDVLQEMSVFLRAHGDFMKDGRVTGAEAAEYRDIAQRLQACIAAQVLFVERQAITSAVVPMRRGGAA